MRSIIIGLDVLSVDEGDEPSLTGEVLPDSGELSPKLSTEELFLGVESLIIQL